MTLAELDDVLDRFGLDFESKEGLAIRDRILSDYGQSIIDSKPERCLHCQFRRNGMKCTMWCDMIDLPSDPKEVALKFINGRNSIQVFPFMCQFVIPVYEETSGETGVMDRIKDSFFKRWKEEKCQ